MKFIRKNPGTIVKVKIFKDADEEYVFKSPYICHGALKRRFLNGCKRAIALAACFLKGPWNGQGFIIVGSDSNNQTYPIVWDMGQTEKREVCEWFITLLQADLEIRDGIG